MSPHKRTLKFEMTIQAPVAQVFRAFTNSTAMREWLCDGATTYPQAGGRCYLWWSDGYYTSGEFTALEEDKLVAFTWHGRTDPGTSQVKVTLQSKKGATRLRLVHSGLGAGEKWAAASAEFEKGWNYGLENLVHVLEIGPDLRIVRRPMVGIGLSDFNAEIAARLGVPVVHGLRLDNVIDGMGAQKAGLQANDVIVGLAGVAVKEYTDFANVVGGKRAGDKVDLDFYRGPEKHTVKLTFSQRPLPEIPPVPSGLADEVAKIYKGCEDDLDKFVAGVGEVEASFKPGGGEWNVKEVLAHLIHSERGTLQFLTTVLEKNEASYDAFGENVHLQVQATATAFKTLVALVTEWKTLNQETIAFLRGLPAEFVSRKGSYWRIGHSSLQNAGHFYTHLEQMQAAVKSARG